MLNVLKNNYCRILPRLATVLVMLAVAVASIFLAVCITGRQQVEGRVALINPTTAVILDSKVLAVTTLKKEPPYSALVKRQYDAYVVFNPDGGYTIKTLRSDDFKKLIELVLKNPGAKLPADPSARGVGVNIIGFMMMFLSLNAFFFMFPFAQDKEEGQLARITASPLSFSKYLAMHCVFCVSSFVPALIVLAVLKAVGFDIGFSISQYTLLLLALAIFSVSLSLILNAFFKKPDNANMFGNSILIITTTLAGCFYSFSRGNKVLDVIVKVLPQKQFLNFAQYMQNGGAASHPLPLIYVLAFSFALFSAAVTKLRREYLRKA